MINPIVGVDVGGPAKGFHAVAISGRNIVAKTASRSATVIARWCKDQGATVVAVDAPCRWRTGKHARLAERELARDRISCFSTPTDTQAQGHAFFTWMIAGAELYAALADDFPIYDGSPQREHVAIETFPQAVACALAGEIVSAKRKNDIRRELIRLSGIDATGLANIDEIDAVLCALAASSFARDDFKSYGDAAGGFIIAPKARVAGFAGANFAPPPKAPPRPARHATTTNFEQVLAALSSLTPAERLALRSRLDDLDS